MDGNQFKNRLENALQALGFIDRLNIEAQAEYAEGEIFLAYSCFVKFYYESEWRKFSFGLIVNSERIWAIDKDIRVGWYRHPLNQVQIHESIAAQTIEEILEELKSVWEEIKFSRK
jgi:hypothetical protein